MARIRSQLYNRRGGSHFGQYFFLLSLGSAFLMMTSGYLSRQVAGGLIDFSGVLLGKPSRTPASSGGSVSYSSSNSNDSERIVGSQEAKFWGDSSSGWNSSSGFSLAVDNPNSIKGGAAATTTVGSDVAP